VFGGDDDDRPLPDADLLQGPDHAVDQGVGVAGLDVMALPARGDAAFPGSPLLGVGAGDVGDRGEVVGAPVGQIVERFVGELDVDEVEAAAALLDPSEEAVELSRGGGREQVLGEVAGVALAPVVAEVAEGRAHIGEVVCQSRWQDQLPLHIAEVLDQALQP
jgi:hypothetical protein